MEPCSAFCGPVIKKGSALPPVPKKWDTVPLLRGRVKRRSFGKWIDIEKKDLDNLEKVVDKPSHILAGAAVAGAYPVVSSKCEYNAFKALCARVFRPPSFQPTDTAWEVANKFRHLLLKDFTKDHTPLSFDEWLDGMPARRKKLLHKASVDLLRFGWKKKYTKFQAFVKTEKLCGYEHRHETLRPVDNLIDRLIQAPHDAAHCVAGPFLKPLVYRLKEVWGVDNPIFYASRKMEDVQAWLDKRLSDGPFTAFAADYSMFDNTHSKFSWDFMEEIYREAGSDCVRFLPEVLRAWRSPQGSISGKHWSLKYKGPVMNCSGRDDTSLANGVLNGVVMFISAVAAHKGCEIHELTEHDLQTSPIRIAVAGDDSLGFMPYILPEDWPAFATRLSSNIALFGFDAAGDKLVMADDPAKLVFLGQRPYPVRGRWYWGKTIGRALFKFGWKTAPFNVDLGAWFAGECYATSLCQAHVPILSDLADNYLRSRPGGKITHVVHDLNRPWVDTNVSPGFYDETTIEACARIYDTSPDAIWGLINRLRENVLTFPCVLSDPILARAVLIDEA